MRLWAMKTRKLSQILVAPARDVYMTDKALGVVNFK